MRSQQISIDGFWKLCWYEEGKGPEDIIKDEYVPEGWLDAEVPGTVQSALLSAGRIADPLYSRNAEQCRWVAEKEWWYRKEFYVEDDFKGDKVVLTFHGLDTFASIWLNGQNLGSCKNMFRTFSFDVTKILEYGRRNVLVVHLSSPLVKGLEEWRSMDPESKLSDFEPVDRITPEKYGYLTAYVRRAGYSYGSLAPGIITIGIWKGVEIKSYHKVSIEDVSVKTILLEDKKAKVEIEISLNKHISKKVDISVEITLSHGKDKFTRVIPVKMCNSSHKINAEIVVANPKLWWPNRVGKPNLYSLQVKLKSGKLVLDEWNKKVGLREVKVIQKLEDESAFIFNVNDKNIFVRGVNWVPIDPVRNIPDFQKYEKILTFLTYSNINMLRVWGGGVVESEDFYNLCDELGIMIWHDFMFSCSLYPDWDSGFMANVKEEAEGIVRSLRNHPSIILWCGNNEGQWGWDGMKKEKKERLERCFGERIWDYDGILGKVCKELAPNTHYWPGSPWSGGGKDANSQEAGDVHDWSIWLIEYRQSALNKGRFISEFGFQSLPCYDTIARHVPPEEIAEGAWPTSNWKSYYVGAWDTYLKQMKGFGEPRDVREAIFYSGLMNGIGLKYCIEHFRRLKYRCGGTLYWQAGSTWSIFGHGLIDHLGIPKMKYYFIRRAYQDVLVSFKEDVKPDLQNWRNPVQIGDTISVWLTNDSPYRIDGTLELSLKDFDGNIIWTKKSAVDLEPGRPSIMLDSFKMNEISVQHNDTEFLLAVIVQDGKKIAENTYYFVPYRERKFPESKLKASIKNVNGGYEIVVAADKFASVVELLIPGKNPIFTDNYFDILPCEKKSVLMGREGLNERIDRLHIKAHNSSLVVVELA